MYNYQVSIIIKPKNVFLEENDLDIALAISPIVQQVFSNGLRETSKQINVQMEKEITFIYNFATEEKIDDSNKAGIKEKIECKVKGCLKSINFKYNSIFVLICDGIPSYKDLNVTQQNKGCNNNGKKN